MKQHHSGIDIIEIERIREAVERWGERFLKRIYTDNEIGIYGGKVPSLAARFAAKEAAMKALSSTSGAVTWKEVEILSEPNGKPVMHLFGKAKQQALDLGLCGLEVSLSHSREYAVALVIGLREG